jgi:hypothetical protein
MSPPFGFGVGDFIAIGTLAWNVHKSCKNAPESFNNIASEVLSLHAVLKEAEETILTQPLPPKKQERLKVVGDGCRSVLEDLDKLIERYESLGSQGTRALDRMRWGTENVADLRARLTSNIGLLTAWIRCVSKCFRLLELLLTRNLVAYLKILWRRNSINLHEKSERARDEAP